MEPEASWSDSTLMMNVLLDVRDGVDRILEILEENDDEEEADT